jgi:hypothetical protein
MKEIRIADPIIKELVRSRNLRIVKPTKAPGIRIKKTTVLAEITESPKAPLSKNAVKNRDIERTNQILNLMTKLRFFSVLSTSQL